eukprot:5524337-Amphidinium_carterae.1
MMCLIAFHLLTKGLGGLDTVHEFGDVYVPTSQPGLTHPVGVESLSQKCCTQRDDCFHLLSCLAPLASDSPQCFTSY